MKKLIYKLSFIACVLTLVSCDKDLEDINVNPNKPTEVRTTGIFNGANKALMTNTRGGFPSARMALPWVQYSAQRNYTAEDRYQFRVGVNNSLYRDIFLAVKKYKTIIDILEDPANEAKIAAYGDPKNQLAAARVMIAYAQLQALEIYGDIPYYSYGSDDPDFEGMTIGTDNEKATPKFAPQEKIYKDLMKELKEAAESVNLQANNVFSSGDNLFRRPIVLKRFANSLRLKIANRVKNVIPEAQVHINEAIASGVMESNEDNVIQVFQNDKINPAPFYTAAFIDNRNDFAPTNTFVELLKGETNVFAGKVDPRLFRMVAPKTNLKKDDAGVENEVRVLFYSDPEDTSAPSVEVGNYVDRDASFYTGFPIGLQDNFTGSQRGAASQFGAAVYKADYGEVLMEYAEVAFLVSENKNWDDAEYRKGVAASMARWGVAQADIDTYVSSLPAASEETVLTQKYIALYLQPYEAWAEYRRTKYPKTLLLPGQSHDLIAKGPNGETSYTFVPLENLTDLPERITYPSDLDLVNKANKDAAAARMGGDKMNSKLIWAKK